VRAAIGVAPQAIALYDDLSAEENLVLFAQLYGMGRTDARKHASELLEMTGLADRGRDRVKGYSGGMKRRVNLAAALLHDPPLVMLDEPTAGVDPQSRNAILDLVRSMREQGRTVVYTTHYMEEAARLCDVVAIIDHGKLLAMDTVDGLISSHGGKSVVTITRASGADQAGAEQQERIETSDPVRELSSRLGAGAGLKANDIHGVRIDRPDLESVFLHLTGRSLRD
jgi:ABC-2 type transport system ATP-binding protein